MTGPEGNSEFCFPQISMFPETKSRETLRFQGNKIHCSPRNQLLSDLLYSKTKQKQNLKTALRFQRSRATTVNISRATVNCFPYDVIVFAMLPAHGIWRETVSLLDVMWPCSGYFSIPQESRDGPITVLFVICLLLTNEMPLRFFLTLHFLESYQDVSAKHNFTERQWQPQAIETVYTLAKLFRWFFCAT